MQEPGALLPISQYRGVCGLSLTSISVGARVAKKPARTAAAAAADWTGPDLSLAPHARTRTSIYRCTLPFLPHHTRSSTLRRRGPGPPRSDRGSELLPPHESAQIRDWSTSHSSPLPFLLLEPSPASTIPVHPQIPQSPGRRRPARRRTDSAPAARARAQSPFAVDAGSPRGVGSPPRDSRVSGGGAPIRRFGPAPLSRGCPVRPARVLIARARAHASLPLCRLLPSGTVRSVC